MEIYEDYLEHHGILGQKWGVRRYQNYDGSYTKKGLEKYRKSSERLEKAKESLKSAKKSGDQDKIKSSKKEYSNARYQNIKDKRQLKLDYSADEGKKLYAKGKTITGNSEKRNISRIAIAGAIAAGNAVMSKWAEKGSGYVSRGPLTGVPKVQVAFYAYNGALFAAACGLEAKYNKENKRLRSYYAHN